MRGTFGIGVEPVSKAINVGNLFRSAHALGTSFGFTAAACARTEGVKSEPSDTPGRVPFYRFPDVESMALPEGCGLLGAEPVDEADELPSFRLRRCCADVPGAERGRLSPAGAGRRHFVVRMPTRFSLNVGIAGAIVIDHRLISRRPPPPSAAGRRGRPWCCAAAPRATA